jgi:predicted HTH transcriptional regulator
MIPRDLSEWDYERIKDLASKGYLETDTFEFKPTMKSRDSNLDNRIKETACAFTNTNGGFLIFGVLDLDHAGDRMVGVNKSDDLAKDFGDKLNSLSPVPYYDFKNPPIEIPHKNTMLFVVHIPKSVDRPHMKTDVGRSDRERRVQDF